MADYIYLLENRLSLAQQSALQAVRDVVRAKGITLFLVGGAVRDLTSGSSVRDLDVTVQGNALKLKKELEKAGGELVGENDAAQALYFLFPGSVRVEVSSALSVEYPKPNKPVYHAANILQDLRRRDFTANAMALSLNEGSYGLLMDPLNGVADIENRELRLVSNYGFIEDPSRLIHAARLSTRLGWQLEERTKVRYEAAKEEGYIKSLTPWQRGYELEEIVYEEDGLRILKSLEHEGWLKHLTSTWTSSKANANALNELADKNGQLQIQGIRADASAIAFPLLTAKMAPKDVTALKKSFARQGFVNHIDSVEKETKDFGAQFTSKAAAAPSDAWKLLYAAKPESVLSLAFSGKGAPIQNKFKAFFTEWPTAKQRIPYVQMQEMRITPDVAGYDELLNKLFFELMDGKLTNPEELKAFLEPYSPPAPPPTVHLRRPRAAKKEPKKARGKKAAVVEDPETSEALQATEDGSAAGRGTEPAKVKAAAEKASSKPVKAAAAAPTKKASAPEVAKTKSVPPVKPVQKVPAKAVGKKLGKALVPAKKAAAKIVPTKKLGKAAVPAKKATSAKKAAPVKKSTPVAKKVVAKKVPAKKVVAKKAAKPAAKKKR